MRDMYMLAAAFGALLILFTGSHGTFAFAALSPADTAIGQQHSLEWSAARTARWGCPRLHSGCVMLASAKGRC